MTVKNPDVRLFLDVSEHARLDEDSLKNIYGNSLLFLNNNKTDTQGFMIIKNDPYKNKNKTLIISFRGSQQPKDWINDFNAWHAIVPYGNYNSKIRVHQGFLTCYKSIRTQILGYVLENKKEVSTIFVTGHSLGGALALLCAVDIQYNFSNKFEIICYTSGAPAVGNRAFARSYNKRVPDTTRTYMKKDIVPKLPPWWFGLRKYGGYTHVDKSNPIGPRDFWVGLKAFFNFGRNFAANITNHSILLYKKYC